MFGVKMETHVKSIPSTILRNAATIADRSEPDVAAELRAAADAIDRGESLTVDRPAYQVVYQPPGKIA